MKQFCVHGHDTFICGRKPDRSCRECHRIGSRKYSQRPENRARHIAWGFAYNRSGAGRASARKYRQSAKGRAAGLKRTQAWQLRNPLKVRVNKTICGARRRARKLGVTASEQPNIAAVYRRAQWWRSVGFPVAVDHIIPLMCGGAHTSKNLQIIYASENARKGARLDYIPQIVFN